METSIYGRKMEPDKELTNGKVRIIKKADPKKVKAYRLQQARLMKGRDGKAQL